MITVKKEIHPVEMRSYTNNAHLRRGKEGKSCLRRRAIEESRADIRIDSKERRLEKRGRRGGLCKRRSTQGRRTLSKK